MNDDWCRYSMERFRMEATNKALGADKPYLHPAINTNERRTTMTDERKIYFKGKWWLAAVFILALLWFFLGGGLQWISSVL